MLDAYPFNTSPLSAEVSSSEAKPNCGIKDVRACLGTSTCKDWLLDVSVMIFPSPSAPCHLPAILHKDENLKVVKRCGCVL